MFHALMYFVQIVQGKFNIKKNSMDISKMLLSPRQRIFPHNVTDIWTALWEVANSPQQRFSHSSIADKLQLALQCYKVCYVRLITINSLA